MLLSRVRSDLFDRITRVDLRFEHLYFLPRDARAIKPADKLFAFPRKHRADDHLDPARTVLSVLAAFFGIIERKLIDHRFLEIAETKD